MKAFARPLVIALGLCGVLAPPASAALPFSPCSATSAFGCATLSVPLDRSGAIPGSVPLGLHRLRAPGGDGTSAVIALAGGPGQSAQPLSADFAQALSPALSTRDLVVFDQRGTGASGPLDCQAIARASASATAAQVLGTCAAQIGPRRGHYTTSDSVDDIESIRQALGYTRLVLYGTSYGTKVALAYALRYPGHVERLVLDSTVGPSGPDIFSRSTISAVPGVLRALCGASDCSRITADPVADLQRLVAQLRSGPLVGEVVDARGHRRKIAVQHDDMLGILVAGDEDPTLRAALPGAVKSALSGDPAPLARLRLDALGDPNAPATSDGVDVPLFFATECEELGYPWTRTASPQTKLAQLTAAAAALDPAGLLPFDNQAALRSGPSPDCAFWPQATAAPQNFSGSLPAVPALVLSGADDLRTPTSDARLIASQIPGAQLVVVPNNGHSVIGTDRSSCSGDAVRAFFTGAPIRPCLAARRPALLRPTAIPPINLAAVPAASGSAGRSGRAVAAAALTLQDAVREVELGVINAVSAGTPLSRVRSGGLRAGYAVLSQKSIRLHGYSYVPGVRLNGVLSSSSRGSLSISGKVSGRLRLGARSTLAGTLAGRHVRLRVRGLAAVATSARGAHHRIWQIP